MSNFRVDGYCRCTQCEWNPRLKRWEGNIQPATDTETFPWMLNTPIECANCGELLTTVIECTPVVGTIPRHKSIEPAFVQQFGTKEDKDEHQ